MARHRSPRGSRPHPLIEPIRRRGPGGHRLHDPAAITGIRTALAAVAAGAVTTGGMLAPATAAAHPPKAADVEGASTAPDAGQSALRPGSEGSSVRDLQRVLNVWHPARTPLAEDGVYGSATEAAVRNVQQRAGVLVDGVVGPQTRGVLGMAPPGGAPDEAERPADPADRSKPPGSTTRPEDPRTEESQPEEPQPEELQPDSTEPEVQAPPDSGDAEVARPAEGRFTSGFGPRWGRAHRGIDIANSIGTPIRSTAEGVVVESGPAGGFGLWVRVQHNDGDIAVYGHINESLVTAGQRVATGEQIATMGNRGRSTGPHLHFEIWEDGSEKVDPRGWLRERGVGI